MHKLRRCGRQAHLEIHAGEVPGSWQNDLILIPAMIPIIHDPEVESSEVVNNNGFSLAGALEQSLCTMGTNIFQNYPFQSSIPTSLFYIPSDRT